MARIKPFKGILYNTESNIDISDKIAPPYDIIDGQLQTDLYVKNQDNIIRIILGQAEPTDTGSEVYERAAGYYHNWIKNKVLVKEKKSAIYIWDQIFDIDGEKKQRRAIVAKVGCSPFSEKEIIPHEKTHDDAKIDRLNLFKSCKSQFSQVFSLYSDSKNMIANKIDKHIKNPILSAKYDDTDNLLYRITAPKTIEFIQNEFKKISLYIADGHHRYETSVKYFEERKKSGYVLMTLVSMEDPGLVILPTHRAINSPLSNLIGFQRLSRKFIIEKGPFIKWKTFVNKLNQIKGEHVFAFANRSLGLSGIIKPIEKLSYDRRWNNKHDVWKNLDVSALHSIIFNDILEMNSDEIFKKGPIYYSHNEEECIKQLENKYNWVFFTRSTKFKDLINVANKNEIMPPKSTFFYPKYLSGFINTDL